MEDKRRRCGSKFQERRESAGRMAAVPRRVGRFAWELRGGVRPSTSPTNNGMELNENSHTYNKYRLSEDVAYIIMYLCGLASPLFSCHPFLVRSNEMAKQVVLRRVFVTGFDVFGSAKHLSNNKQNQLNQ